MSSRKRPRSAIEVGRSVESAIDEEDDDDVEVLWTIPPPSSSLMVSPCVISRPVSRSPVPPPSTMAEDERKAPDRHNNMDCELLSGTKQGVNINSIPNIIVESDTVNGDTVLANHTETKSYSLQSSAYLQNLAEISFTLLHDLRWRVREDRNRRYPTLFQWEEGDDLSVVIALSRIYIQNNVANEPAKKEVLNKSDLVAATDVSSESRKKLNSSSLPEPSVEVRSLYLYCRLFYRKGPWFRIDDIYNKYYQPTIDGTQSLTFSLDELIGMHLTQFSVLMDDICHLHRNGFVRFFIDEAECGKTVGVDGVLTAEERNILLRKLGAGKSRSANDHAALRTRKRFHNPIWQQMSQQTKLFAAFRKKNVGEPNRLPVRCHLETLMLERLVSLILQSVRRVQSIPKEQLRTVSLHLRNSILHSLQEQFSATAETWCLRLREAPLLTLQRCARLYLCATSGPGEMRGNGSNGWRSVHTFDTSIIQSTPLFKTIPPPGLYNWNQVQYPGLSCRFGLTSACFMQAYKHFPVSDDVSPCQGRLIPIFRTLEEFRLWEVCVELRCTVDYLIELNEAMRSEERRRARGKEARHETVTSDNGSVDFFSLLTSTGRRSLLQKLLQCILLPDIEKDVEEILPKFESVCEAVLVVISIVILHVLAHSSLSHEMVVDRPWLRHMSWQACLALMLFDIIPILERCGQYPFAVQSLRVLLFGVRSERDGDAVHLVTLLTHQHRTCAFATWISRRIRGKALDRLIVDCGQIHRLSLLDQEKIAKKASVDAFRTSLVQLCREVIDNASASSAIGFSAIRSLARRLQQPLSEILNSSMCLEAKELGLRLGNAPNESNLIISSKSGYSDWTPITDFFLANSLNRDNNEPGGRCTFVGFEDEPEKSMLSTSLNVEELAMDLYHTGRLPCTEEGGHRTLKGGWIGWHDEGSHVRALFRIICAKDLLGMDFGFCSDSALEDQKHCERATVHLSPYQQAPFDLLVGYELQRSTINPENQYFVASRSFYCRRADDISKFLDKLATLDGEELLNIVHDSIALRLAFVCSYGRNDPHLDRDISQVRTLSAIAVGFGGKCLASIFRCFVFDYRHYSGGLPDLHLFRAFYDCGSTCEEAQMVDLGDWIGESFTKENQQMLERQRASSLLNDMNDELLGFDKASDSGVNYRKPRGSTVQRAQSTEDSKQSSSFSAATLPDRLQLRHNDRSIKVECMMVEVKSATDRLDARQEDWLNIIDKHGSARVCKFLSTHRKKGGNLGAKHDVQVPED